MCALPSVQSVAHIDTCSCTSTCTSACTQPSICASVSSSSYRLLLHLAKLELGFQAPPPATARAGAHGVAPRLQLVQHALGLAGLGALDVRARPLVDPALDLGQPGRAWLG